MKVAVFGLGKLGQPMATVLARAGHDVSAYDIDPVVRKAVAAHEATVDEPMLEEEMAALDGYLYVGETVEDCVANSQVGYVIVPTPTAPGGGFTNKFVLDAVAQIGKALKGKTGHYTVVICSTVMPGSTQGEIAMTLGENSERPFNDGVDGISLVYSPQFIALGTVLNDMRNPDVLLIGTKSQRGYEVTRRIAETIHDRDDVYIAHLKPTEAEIVKLGINTYITNKITFANLIGQVCAAVPDVDGYTVTKTIGQDSRIGTKYATAGGPYGGPCFPRDTDAFAAFVDSFTHDVGLAQIAHATSDINDLIIERVARAAVRSSNDPFREKEASILLLGFGYKPASGVTEESFAVRLMQSLSRHTNGLGLPFTIFGHDVNLTHPVPFDVTYVGDPAPFAEHEDFISIVCTPEVQYANLQYSTVIDVWGIVPDENAAQLINYRDGNGNHLLSAR